MTSPASHSQGQHRTPFRGQAPAAGHKEVTGTFIIPYQGQEASGEESSEDDDAEENDVFLDYRDMHAADNMVRSRLPKQTKVELKDKAGKKHTCHGRFPMTQAYWEVTVKMNRTYLRSAPVYSVRTDLDSVRAMNLVTVFLSDCLEACKDATLQNGTKACFEAFCRTLSLQGSPTFGDLGRLLQRYRRQERAQGCFLGRAPQGGPGHLPQANHSLPVEKYVLGSDLGSTVLVSASHPLLVRTLSGLFPYAFQPILKKLTNPRKQHGWGQDQGQEEEEEGESSPDADGDDLEKPSKFLQMADTMAQGSPWEFCFREILIKKLKLVGIEASLKAYMDAGFLPRTPLRERDALFIYEVLKTDAKRNGHMYVPFSVLRGHYHFRKLDYSISGLERWNLALDYLDTNGIIKREEFGGDSNIFLIRNWQAEVDTAESINSILERHQREPFVWDVSFHSPEFSTIRMDNDQLRASMLICASPVVVMSGRGGCGKTTVITRLLKHLCNREERRLEEEKLRNKMAEEGQEDGVISQHGASLIEPLTQMSLSAQGSMGDPGVDGQPAPPAGGDIKPEAVPGTSGISTTIPSEVERDHNLNSGTPSQAGGSQRWMRDKSHTREDNTDTSSQADGSQRWMGDKSHTREDNSGTPSQAGCKQGRKLPHHSQTKEERLKRELVDDLLKILSQSKEKDEPELEDFKRKMLLTAPTGKAARLLGVKAGLPSATLHSVLTSWQMYQRGQTEGGWKYAPVEILVVDECSLVSVRLFANVVKILLDKANLRKMVLLGDVRQLPSIEPGDFLKDVFKTLGRAVVELGGKSVVTSDSHFSLAVELSHNHRSESQLIVENAERISGMVMPTFDSRGNFHLVKTMPGGGDNERDQAIRQLLQTSPDLRSHLHSQFVSFRNAHCLAVNELCCQFYNGHSLKGPSQSGKREKFDFRVGDKICLGKNNQVSSNHKVYLDTYKAEFPELTEALDREEGRLKHKLTIKESGEECGGSQSGKVPQNETLSRKKQEEEKGDYKGEKRGGLDASGVLDLLDQDEQTFNTTIRELKGKEQEAQRATEERRQRARQQQRKWKTKSEKKKSETLVKKMLQGLLGEDLEKLCNGEVFFIMDEVEVFEESSDNSSRRQSRGPQRPTRYLLLSDRDPDVPRVMCVPFKQLRKLCKMRHSWVRTIHTYQGSESDTVVYVLGPAMPQTWQHVYTAVTRGRKSVYVLGDWEQLNKAVKRRPEPRRTRLAHRLADTLRGQGASLELCRQEFVRRTAADTTEGTPGRHASCDADLFDFGSDDSWLLEATSPQADADSAGGAYQESAVGRQTDRDICYEQTCSPNHDDRVGKEKSLPPLNSLVEQGKQKTSCVKSVCVPRQSADGENLTTEPVLLSSCSESDEEEESIFAPLSRHKERQKIIPRKPETAFNTCGQGREQKVTFDERDLPPLTETQFLQAEENFGKYFDEYYYSFAADDAGDDNDVTGYKVVNRISKTLPNPSSSSTTRLPVLQTTPTKQMPHTDHEDPSSFHVGDISPNTVTHSDTRRQNELTPPAFKTPTKRVSRGECTPPKADVSPSKLQRMTPLLHSFSHSLTFDGETGASNAVSLRDSEESPLPVKRKL